MEGPCVERCDGELAVAVPSRDDRGAAALEFALILPILVVLVFGVIAFGYMLSFRQAMSQAAAEGGRAAAVQVGGTSNGDRISAARAAINDALDSYGVECTSGGALTHAGGASGTCAITIGSLHVRARPVRSAPRSPSTTPTATTR